MKVKKKLFACLLAFAMILSMGTTAFAAEEETPQYENMESVTVTKVYRAANDDTTSPAETFTLEQVGNGIVTDGEATSAPHLGNITGAEFAAGAATTNGAKANIKITLPEYERVGVYEYTLQEVAGTTAGVAYYGKTIKLVVTVIEQNGKICVAAVHTEDEGEQKSDEFENIYSAGTLSISKKVTGNLGDKEKYFEFQLTLKGEKGKNYAESYAVGGTSYKDNPTSVEVKPDQETKYTFWLKDGESVNISNLPYGVTYTVTETDYKSDGYTTTKAGDTGTIGAASQTAAFINDKSGSVDTGVYLDNLPYILVFAGVVAVVAVMVVFKKRRYDD